MHYFQTVTPHAALTRRRVLKIIGAFFLANAALPPDTFAAPPSSANAVRTFAAFLDVLLPRDAHSGAATDLQVDLALWSVADDSPLFHKLIMQGSYWLDEVAEGSFSDLNDADQIKVVEWMAADDWNQVPRRFYELVRQAAVEIYYSHPKSLAGLPLQTSPQPQGYPPPWH